jgi:hypothetical protein
MAKQHPGREATQATALAPWAGRRGRLGGQLRPWWDRLTEADLAQVVEC